MTLRPGQRIKCVKYWDKRSHTWPALPSAIHLDRWLEGHVTYRDTNVKVPVQVVYHTSSESHTDKLRTLWEAQLV